MKRMSWVRVMLLAMLLAAFAVVPAQASTITFSGQVRAAATDTAQSGVTVTIEIFCDGSTIGDVLQTGTTGSTGGWGYTYDSMQDLGCTNYGYIQARIASAGPLAGAVAVSPAFIPLTDFGTLSKNVMVALGSASSSGNLLYTGDVPIPITNLTAVGETGGHIRLYWSHPYGGGQAIIQVYSGGNWYNDGLGYLTWRGWWEFCPEYHQFRVRAMYDDQHVGMPSNIAGDTCLP